VSDVVDALIKLIDRSESVGEVYNIGSTEEVTINRLAEIVRQLTASSSEIVHIPYDEAYESGFEDVRRRVPDTSKVAALIGFRPTHSLEDIVRSVVQFEQAGGDYAWQRDAAVTGSRL
jgi:UDP-glucose 4-epimerase